MNNTETLRERIEQIINKENLTYTQFARRIGIQGTIVSHIMNGRNKPSLDVIMKILENFKNINAEWLLFGNGETYKKAVIYLLIAFFVAIVLSILTSRKTHR